MEIIIITAEHMGIITGKWVNLLERLVSNSFGKVIFLTGFSRGVASVQLQTYSQEEASGKTKPEPYGFPPCPYPGFCLWKNFSQIINEETKEKG